MKNKEVEFKYPADGVELSAFHDFCTKRNPLKFIVVSGYDHFFAKKSEPNSFYRHRLSTSENQLTFKRKLNEENNFIREEHNIELPHTVSAEKIADLCGVNGYIYNNSIFKNCFIYFYDYYDVVYYICYDRDLKELGRFIEIEMKEDYGWASPTEAYSELLTLEKLCRTIGTTSKRRIKRSLFEMYRRET